MREAVLQKMSPVEAIPSPAAPPIQTTARSFVAITKLSLVFLPLRLALSVNHLDELMKVGGNLWAEN
jgi:hypothetical protein